jgi:PAS domain S-box-containing protein
MRDRSILYAFAFSLLIFTIVGVAAFQHFGRFGAQNDWVIHTERVLGRLEDALGEMKDAETGQRGYLLTGKPQFLQPYDSSIRVVRASFRGLEELTADNASQGRHLEELFPLVEEKIRFMEETIATFDRGEVEAAREMVASTRGKRLMDEIRARVDSMAREEQRLLHDRMARAESMAWRTTLLMLFGNGFGFALLATGTLLLGREFNRRYLMEQELELRRARVRVDAHEGTQERRMTAILDEMPVGVMLVDREGGVIFVNDVARRLVGPELIPGSRAPLKLLRPDGTPLPQEDSPIARALARGEVVRAEEVQVRSQAGGWISLMTSTAPIRDASGKAELVVAVFDDQTATRQEDSRREAAERFRDLFVGALGHDMRNPLTVITAGTAALARRATGPAEGRIVSRMSLAAERIATMIDQLLDMAQLRLGGALEVARSWSNLGEITRRTIERVEVVHPERTIEVTAQGDLAGSWDPARITQLVSYLVVNAIEHGRADTPIQVTVREDGSSVLLEVMNAGPAISPELVPLMFDPFLRAAERMRMRSNGLGLGLYLSLQIARAHGGEVDVVSTEAGTLFRARLPKAIDDHA